MTEPSADPAASRSAAIATGSPLVRAGLVAWSLIGIAAVLLGVALALNSFKLVVIPLVLALFPAALLMPVVRRLQRWGWPPVVAVVFVSLLSVLGIATVLLVLTWLVFTEFRVLLDNIEEAYLEIADFVARRLDLTLPPLDDLVARLEEWSSSFDVGGTATSVAFTTLEIIAGTLLGVFALFFYLKDADRLRRGLVALFPQRLRSDADAVARRAWYTIGGYFRGQLLVAAVDAVLIGIGLFILGVPLALPLALIIFFGGLFPIIGAFVAGAIAVLVALGSGGLGLALAVLILNVVVQQLESNLLQPIIMSRITHLHPLAVIASVTAGAVSLGVLGAFLAVPIVAAVVQGYREVRRRHTAGGDPPDGSANGPAPPGLSIG